MDEAFLKLFLKRWEKCLPCRKPLSSTSNSQSHNDGQLFGSILAPISAPFYPILTPFPPNFHPISTQFPISNVGIILTPFRLCIGKCLLHNCFALVASFPPSSQHLYLLIDSCSHNVIRTDTFNVQCFFQFFFNVDFVLQTGLFDSVKLTPKNRISKNLAFYRIYIYIYIYMIYSLLNFRFHSFGVE